SGKESRTYRLPTEAEWEYCCRAGSKTAYGYGNDDSDMDEYGWHFNKSHWQTHPVGQLKPNAWGLYDMHGNASEWCLDSYEPEFYRKSPKKDPRSPIFGPKGVSRGGAWLNAPMNCRSAVRDVSAPMDRNNLVGFRIVLLPASTETEPPPKSDSKPAKTPSPKEGWVQLFNGRDLTGWKTQPGEPGDWKVEDGILVGRGPKRSHLYSRRDDYENFHFLVEAKINQGGNSGQLFRTQVIANHIGGYEAQIDSSMHKAKTGSLYITGGRPAVAVEKTLVPVDTWLTQEVIAQGNHIIIKVNGQTVVDYIDKDNTWKRGYLALQVFDPATVVQFRRVEVKELKPQ
ncbi:hypothetical protein BHU16_10360, partial [Tannerella sp. oral taxon 808]